jgi:acetaldehyde dehydrogenase
VSQDRIRVAILGSGNIGIDLCERLLVDDDFDVVALVGHRVDSPGLQRFENRIPDIVTNGIDGLIPHFDSIDGVFDATSSFDHPVHWDAARQHGKWIIDLTPSGIGRPTVPCLVNRVDSMHLNRGLAPDNLSMISCGGQSAGPVLYAITQGVTGIREVEVSISVSSGSVGPASRRNVDHYIEATEALATQVTGCPQAKAMLILNPAEPPVMMRTTIFVRADVVDLDAVKRSCAQMVTEVQHAVPGYDLAVEPHCPSEGLVCVTVRVIGAGFYLPPHAGNLDIINSAAVESARILGRQGLPPEVSA